MTLSVHNVLIGVACIIWVLAILVAEGVIDSINIQPISLVALGLISFALSFLPWEP